MIYTIEVERWDGTKWIGQQVTITGGYLSFGLSTDVLWSDRELFALETVLAPPLTTNPSDIRLRIVNCEARPMARASD